MSKVVNQPTGEIKENVKRLKNEMTFWSSLNDNFVIPEKPMQCTWHQDADPQQSPHRTAEWRHPSNKVYPDALAAIGNTPLIKLNRIPQAEGLKCEVYAKCEYFNPGGSLKDRIAGRLIADAERQGLLKPGYTIIEATSGNTGIGLALAAAIRGYRIIIVLPEKMSNEKVSTLMALGAEIVRTPLGVGSEAPNGMFAVAHKLKKEIPNSIILNQFNNPGNPLSHYDTTAEEIYDQMDEKVDMIVIGAGTGGTITGIGRKFKEISPKTQIIAADPEGSVLSLPESLNKTDVTFYEVEGIGYEFVPTVLDRSIVSKWIKVHDRDALPMAKRLIREEGLLIGSSSGAVLTAAIRAAKNLEAGKRVVVVLPDSIRNYMTKFVSDHWMEARSFQPSINTKGHWWWDVNVTSLKLETLLTAKANMTCDRVHNMIMKNGYDQIPVVDNNNGIIGVATLQSLTNGLISGKVQANSSISDCLVRVYPKVFKSANLGVISRVLEKDSYVVILEAEGSGSTQINKPFGIVTSTDLWKYITENHK